jgi:16S rRNA (guanine527-N7)-methyltransferase
MEDLVEEHLPDAFALSRLVPVGARVVDIGAGGGLPTVPFALLRPDCRITLVEPRAKRAAFLGTALRSLKGAGVVDLLRGRDTDVESGLFDVAVSRATFPPPDWLGLAGRLLAPGGRAVTFSSCVLEEDLGSLVLVDSVSYRTGRGAARWAGAYVPRGTVSG